MITPEELMTPRNPHFALWRALRRVAFLRCGCARCKLALELSRAGAIFQGGEAEAWLAVTDALDPCPYGLRIEFPAIEYFLPVFRAECRIARDSVEAARAELQKAGAAR